MFLFVAPAFAIDATIWPELAKVAQLDAAFSEVQVRRVLKTPLTTTGHVSFTRPGSLTWAVDPPYASTFSLKDGKATMDYPAMSLKQTIDLSQVPDANRLATSMMVWLQADAAAVERDFAVSYGDTDATLVPKDKKLQALFASIRITVAPSPWRVASVTLVEPSGDRAEIRFHDVKTDGTPQPDP